MWYMCPVTISMPMNGPWTCPSLLKGHCTHRTLMAQIQGVLIPSQCGSDSMDLLALAPPLHILCVSVTAENLLWVGSSS